MNINHHLVYNFLAYCLTCIMGRIGVENLTVLNLTLLDYDVFSILSS